MTLIIEIALGIVLGFILLSYLDVIIGSAVVLVGGAIALGVLFFAGSYFFEHLSDVFELAKGLLLTVLVVFGSSVIAFFVGWTSQKLPGLRKLGSSDKSTTLKEVIDDFSINKKSDLYIDFLADKIRIGYLTIVILGFVYLFGLAIGMAFFQFEFGGFIGVALVYALLILLVPYAQKPHQMTDAQLKEQIEIRKGLGYDTKDLEDKFISK